MGKGSDPKLEIESEPLFPGFTEKVPKDVVANLNNVTLEVTTIIVCINSDTCFFVSFANN